MSAGLLPFLTHPALDWTVLPLRIVRALGATIATAATAAAAVVTKDHAAPGEAVLTADVTGATPGGDPDPVTHRDPGAPGIAAIGHSPAGGADPIIEVGLDPQGGTPVIDLILQIANVPNVLRSLLTGNDVEHQVFCIDTIP